MSLIADGDLDGWMGKTLDPDRSSQAIRIAEGWLLSATRIDPWPQYPVDVIPEDLRAWTMELSALCYVNNPKSAIERQVGGIITRWAPDDQAKCQQILAAAKARYNQIGMPKGSFPCAQKWPDEATDWPRRGVFYW